jgi:uncharacterized protein (TIGR03067 family)
MRQDIDLLQGSWTIASLELDGEKLPETMLADSLIVIEGNRFTSTGMGMEYKGTIALDTTAKPRRLDMKFNAGPQKGTTNLCIYEIEGDAWKLCIATHGPKRPTRFASTAGSGIAFETLRRTNGARAKSKSMATTRVTTPASTGSAPATEFEGEWRMLSGVMDGKSMEESMVKWVKRVTQGNQTTVYAGPQVMLKVEFTADGSQSPKAIDYVHLAGAHKGKTQLGIYEIDSDVLKMLMAAPGAARPGAFPSKPGKGTTFTVWQRA